MKVQLFLVRIDWFI